MAYLHSIPSQHYTLMTILKFTVFSTLGFVALNILQFYVLQHICGLTILHIKEQVFPFTCRCSGVDFSSPFLHGSSTHHTADNQSNDKTKCQ